ncbi:pogo transposable element with KRAB domain-like protein [Aphelenchoides avenae]|nr:pogo transposable element with KRAB domain-like protein [Aphelenchus avenae]
MSAKRKSYTLEVKLEAIEMAKRADNVRAATHFQTDECSIRRWRDKEAQFRADKKKHGGYGKRLKGGGRPLKDKEFDDKLALWVRGLRETKLRVSRKMVQTQARKLLEKHPVEGAGGKMFAASIGWVRRFMARHGFTLRRRTTTCQKPPEHYKEKVVRFIRYVEELRKAQNFAFIYACDETAIAMDGNGGLTIEEKGAKEVRDLSFYPEIKHI